MTRPVKRRPYASPLRAEQAASTRTRIVEAAGELFVSLGYSRTTVREIANRAGVAADTVYASFGSKARVLTALIDSRLVPGGGAANVMDRPEAGAVRDELDQRAQIRAFSRDMAAVSARVRPVYEILRTAAAAEPDVAPILAEMDAYRFGNMRQATEWIAARGPLRMDLDRAAETIWTLAAPDVARMLCDIRGWTEAQYADWLGDALTRLLLPDGA